MYGDGMNGVTLVELFDGVTTVDAAWGWDAAGQSWVAPGVAEAKPADVPKRTAPQQDHAGTARIVDVDAYGAGAGGVSEDGASGA